MNSITKFAAAAASFVAFSAAAASSQAAVYIGLQQAGVNGGAITTVATDASVAVFNGSYGTFEGEVVTAVDAVYPALLTMNTNDLNTGGPAGTLDIWVTLTDITTDTTPSSYFSSFTSNVLPQGWSVTFTSFVDFGNGLYGGEQLATNTFNTIGTFTSVDHVAGGGVPGTYSVTTRYTLNAPTAGSAISTGAIAAVPEPATWALMIMGFGGAGAMIRRRRQVAVAA